MEFIKAILFYILYVLRPIFMVAIRFFQVLASLSILGVLGAWFFSENLSFWFKLGLSFIPIIGIVVGGFLEFAYDNLLLSLQPDGVNLFLG
ncbi:hypothetical protein QJU83_04780 [Pasteurella skyensis]|uniref:hypothetical protein n=1 Tax=Phocoenobacter skyensis TaxID=97481 RepID=UPI00276D748E|nr:hypothetical protein [Pasteurella skyensis]MDP8176856.1 hypothetical protein [Pasteurella skyensis]MDP8199455.1 hypothetical protein [Pasteurella skyensis]